MNESFDNWTVQLRKGILEFCVLSAIARAEEVYGYELVRELVNIEGLDVSEGSVYPLLSRLRKQGVVSTRLEESESGPARKYYRLTSSGQARTRAMELYYDGMQAAVATIRESSLSNEHE